MRFFLCVCGVSDFVCADKDTVTILGIIFLNNTCANGWINCTVARACKATIFAMFFAAVTMSWCIKIHIPSFVLFSCVFRI